MGSQSAANCKIHVAFRFHVNLYHSYRMDTIDEMGLGKDIRVITYILDVLDRYNKSGVPVRGTWDIENYYSLQMNMKALCPGLIERIKQRVATGTDEVELMSYNNGIISAHTREEATAAIQYAVSNPEGSGLRDIFGKYAPIVRPQECMMTPSLIKVYKEAGIEAFSIFYSCIPFNGFSNFVPLLPARERFNPLWYTAPGYDDKMILLPCINPADTFDNGGVAALVKKLRKEQLAMEKPCDLLVLLDMDADDDYWQGYINTTLSFAAGLKKPLIKGGLQIVIKKLSRLPYVVFDTPYDYLKAHPPVGTVCFGQDTADGAYDGYSPWVDKLENTKLWTAAERNRLTCEYARAVSQNDKGIAAKISGNLKERIRVYSTTHFGLSTPVMCRPRLLQAFDMVAGEQKKSERLMEKAQKLHPLAENEAKLVFPKQYYKAGKVKGLLRLNAAVPYSAPGVVESFVREVFGKKELDLVYEGDAADLPLTKAVLAAKTVLEVTATSIANDTIKLTISGGGLTLLYNGKAVTEQGSFESSVKYAGKRITPNDKTYTIEGNQGNMACITETGRLILGEGKEAAYQKKYTIAGGLPYLYADVDIRYPVTGDFGMSKAKSKKLYRTYDTRWEEIMPFEIIPVFRGNPSQPVRVYKHNFMGEMSRFDFDYYKYSRNRQISSSNNALTCGFVSFAAGGTGLLLAQSVAADNSMAFASVRLTQSNNEDTLKINPFGIYRGSQLIYNTEKSRLVSKATEKFSDSLMSCAPTYRGGRQQFSLMIAPFDSAEPGGGLINDALLFAYPPYVHSADENVKMIDFTEVNNYEPLG